MPIQFVINGLSAVTGKIEKIIISQDQARELQGELEALLGPYVPPEKAAKATDGIQGIPPLKVPVTSPAPKPGPYSVDMEKVIRDMEEERRRRDEITKKWPGLNPPYPHPPYTPPTWAPSPSYPGFPPVWCGTDKGTPRMDQDICFRAPDVNFTSTAVIPLDTFKNSFKYDISSNPADNKGKTFP